MTVPLSMCYVIVTVMFYPSAWTLLTIRPTNVTAKVNQSTYMNCSTTSERGVKWYVHGNTVICAVLECFGHYKERFRVENIISTGSWNLVISSVQAEDAGIYRCEEIGFESSDHESAQLIVLEEKESTGGKPSDGLSYISTTIDTAINAMTNAKTEGSILVITVVLVIIINNIIVCLVKKKRDRERRMNEISNEDQPLRSITTTNEDQQPMSEPKDQLLTGDNGYFDRPILEKTIKTKVAKEKNLSVRAVSVFNDEIFVATDNSCEIEVFDAVNLEFKHCLQITNLINPLDMKPCLKSNCLYIIDCEYVGQPGKILKIDHEGNILAQWPYEDSGARLSVTTNGNILVSLCNNDKIVEYNSDGRQVREIARDGPRHAILLENKQFLISQGYSDDDEFHRVFLLSLEEGKTGFQAGINNIDEGLVETYGEDRGGSTGQMNVPWYMAVDKNGYVLVAERDNQRVTLLSPTLKFEKILISKEDGLRRPLNMYLDVPRARLFVTDFEWEKTNRVNGQLLVFKIRNPDNIQE